jgi:PhoPQ-activated pathogenicity-related protein
VTTRRPAAVALLVVLKAAVAGAALDGYVGRPEAVARWEEHARIRDDDLEVVRFRGVSQTWKGIDWTHDVIVARPHHPRHPDVALLVVSASAAVSEAERLARLTRQTVAVVGGIPNQPLLGGRYEDDLVAETFARYLATGDAEWPLLQPMTKAAAWAMNVAQAGDDRVRRFVVTGASKRGWTTWLVAAVDPRVAGIVPVVFDNLRFEAQLQNQQETWGRYSPQIGDYTTRGLARAIDTPRGRALLLDVDPWSYRSRLARPRKLLVHGTNDPYWAVDAIRFYWDDIPGDKSVLYVPNGGHGIAGAESVERATAAFVDRVASGRDMPTVAATIDRTIGRVTTSESARGVRVWWAQSLSRDFRDAEWRSTDARREGDAWSALLPPNHGRTVACFAEATFDGAAGPYPLSTPVRLLHP